MKKLLQLVIAGIYLIGIGCVIFFTVKYFRFSDYVANPNAMLPIPDYEGAALMLLFGTPVMLASCVTVVLTFQKMKKWSRIAVFLPVLICVGVVGHYLLIGGPAEAVDARQFTVAVELDTEDPIYAIGMDILMDGEPISGQSCCNADGRIPLKETILFTVIPEDVPQGKTLRDLTLVFKLHNVPMAQEESDGIPVENGTVSCTDWEDAVSMMVTGDETGGYRASFDR